MSEIYDRLKDLERKNSTISQALKKNGDALPGGMPPEGPPQPEVDTLVPDSKKGTGFSLAIFSLFLMMGVTAVTVVIFTARTIDKVGTASRQTEQMAALLDTQVEKLIAVEEKMGAVEAEFRRAFKKDREQIAEIDKKIAALDAQLTADIRQATINANKQLREEFQEELGRQKVVLAEQGGRTSKAERDYNDLITRFGHIQEEFNNLRAKLLEVTVEE